MFQLKLLGILMTGFVDSLGIGLVYPIFAALLFDGSSRMVAPDATLAWRGALLGILIALTPLTQFFSSPIMGTFSDIKGRKLALTCGISLGFIGYCLAVVGIWTNALFLLFFYHVLVGVSDGTQAVAQAALADISKEENKARHFSLLNACQGFGFTIGPFLGGNLSHYGYDVPFLAGGAMSLVNLLLVVWKFPETRRSAPDRVFNFLEGLSTLAAISRWKELRWIFAAGFVLAFGWSFFSEFAPVFLRARFDFSASEMGNFYACCGGWYALSAAFMTAPLLKRIAAERLVTISFLACSASLVAFGLVQEVLHVWIVLPFIMYAMALIYPTASAIISNRTHPDRQGEVLGIYQSLMACAMGVSPLVVGSAVGVYPALAAVGSAAAMFFGAYAFWMGCRQPAMQVSQ